MVRINIFITIKDVAKEAKVSVATVSHVINKTRFVSEFTRQKVLKAMARLHYQPDGIAQSLRSKRTNTIGLIISDIANSFYPEVVRGIEKEMVKKGYSIILTDTDDNIEKEKKLVTLLFNRRVDGFIIVTAGEEKEHIEFLLQRDIPVVLLDRRINGLQLDTVLVDNRRGTKKLIQRLISLGHKRIAIITGSLNVFTGKERLNGYLEALKEHSLPVDDQLIKKGNFRRESGYFSTLELLSLNPPPSVIFACNNLIGLGVMDALQEKEIQIPEEMGIAIFDDLPWFKHLSAPLTVVAQPTFRLGEMAAKLLLERIKGKRKKPKEVVLGVELRQR
ncbi:LacI family DNA-binding transcriptional regulator [Candidatus Aerophobetes bacterium]|nr:LacI family DNA-binding transcriptional regulator [Candidatus Aerophobetes bacterium]